MQVIVKSRHTRVPDSLKDLAVQKIEKVQKFMNRIAITKLEIEFSEENNSRAVDRHVVEVALSTKAHLLRAVGSGPDPASAIDSVVDKLQAQAKKLKEKTTERGRTGAGGTPPETIRIPGSGPRPPEPEVAVAAQASTVGYSADGQAPAVRDSEGAASGAEPGVPSPANDPSGAI